MRPARRQSTLLVPCALTGLIVLATDARAADRHEYAVDLDAHHKLSARTRLYLSGSVTDVESAGSFKGQGGVYLDVTLKGAVRERLHLADWARSRPFWIRVGYTQLRTWDGQFEDVSERRGVFQLTARVGSWRKFQLTHRLGFDYRDLEGQDSQRYRYRLDVERETKVGQTAVIPYVRGEVFYDTRYSAWSKQSYQLGSEIDLNSHWRIEPWFALDRDTRPATTYTDRLGLTFKFYW